YYDLNDMPNAVATFQQLAAARPEDPTSHYYLGLCYQRLDRTGDAIRELESVRRRDPGFGQTRLILGRLYLQANRVAEGRQLLDEFRQAETREHEKARLGLAVANHPRSAEAHWQMARIYQEQGDRPHMRVEARKTLELAPYHAGARALLKL